MLRDVLLAESNAERHACPPKIPGNESRAERYTRTPGSACARTGSSGRTGNRASTPSSRRASRRGSWRSRRTKKSTYRTIPVSDGRIRLGDSRGGSDPGEDPLETAKRELREEAGLAAKQWAPLGGEIHLSNCISSEVGRLYIACDLIEVAPEPDGTEVLQIKKIPFAEALEMVDAGEIETGFDNVERVLTLAGYQL
ncbi:MAG: NUDIX hydrolase [Candidatus Hydrogenedentes bacterium]|nr:NUDIX hydrolase [Candidatus Hydrogenedentota bacterium]